LVTLFCAGILDLYFFVGPKPLDVIRQYHELIGTPFLPPYWALGWHQCRWGYQNVAELQVRWSLKLDYAND
jgi:alpha-glucosidase (family GH31 glycosyl hydrolase)